MKIKITLDTNCIINLLDDKSKTRTSIDDLKYILKLIDEDIITAYVTTRFVADQSNDRDRDRVIGIATKLSELPINTVGVGFRLDTSTLDGADFLGDDNTLAINNELVRLLNPSGLDKNCNTFSNRINDIDHLIGHYQNNNDIFITDDGGISNKAETLRNILGITIMSPGDFVSYVKNRIQVSLVEGITTNNTKYLSKPSQGSVSFDYSNNNGQFTIGQGIYSFDTKWSKASDKSIHAYKDGQNIDSIAIAKNIICIEDISDSTDFDYSSRARTINIGQILLLKNKSGAYAAVRVTNLQDDTRGASNDLITFDYKIATIGSVIFTAKNNNVHSRQSK